MNEDHMNETPIDTAPEAIDEPTPTEEVAEPTEPSPRKRSRASRTPKRVTLRNRTRRLVVAQDSNGAGIYLFPGIEIEVDSDLVSEHTRRMARLGLLALD